MKLRIAFVLVLLLTASRVRAADLEPTLGKKGKVLLEEQFDGTAVPTGWTKNAGTLAISGGALRISELASDKHAGAFRKALPVQDVAVQFDFQFDKAKMFHIGFDPAPGELKKQGHLFSVVINPKLCSVIEHLDKADPDSKTKTHATQATEFKDGQWYTMLLENKGEQVVVQIQGHESLRASSKDFRVRKPGLVFRVGGADQDGVLLDNVRVWELH